MSNTMAKILTLLSIKGGVGKTTILILITNYLAACGYKVLVLDLDINNSATFYYLLGKRAIDTERRNIAKALYDDGSIDDNIVQTQKENISIIPSSLNLADIRAMNTNRLHKKLRESTALTNFDYIIIDTAPTYDNIVINAIRASDIVLTPVLFDQFNINTTKFLEHKIIDEIPEKLSSWYIIFNGYNEQAAKFKKSIQSQLSTVYKNNFTNILDVYIPRTSLARKHIDTRQKISKNNKTSVRLWSSINRLAEEITGQSKLEIGVF